MKRTHLEESLDIANFQHIGCRIMKMMKIRNVAFVQIVKLLLRKLMNGLIHGNVNVVEAVEDERELVVAENAATATVQVTVLRVVILADLVHRLNHQDHRRDVNNDSKITVHLSVQGNRFVLAVALHL